MPSPLQIIENIAASEDRALSIVFFLFFSRFEFALKRAGYIAAKEEAKPDWQKYARENPALLKNIKGKRFLEAINFLKYSPPKKQIISNGQLAWSADGYSGSFDNSRLFTLVCRIRNNLFHGGKFPTGVEVDISRDINLIDAGLTIMQACLDADEKLRHYFLEELA